jgi:hypothetical protein
MHSDRQVSRSRDPLKKVGEPTALLLAQHRTDQLLMFCREIPNLIKDALARLRQMECIDAAIALLIATLNDPAFLEIIEESDQTTRVHPQRGRHFVLPDAGGPTEEPNDP